MSWPEVGPNFESTCTVVAYSVIVNETNDNTVTLVITLGTQTTASRPLSKVLAG